MACFLLVTNVQACPCRFPRLYCTVTRSLHRRQDENEVISALTGFSIDHVLTGLSLPSGSALSNQLGISGIPSLNSSQIYGKWDNDGAVGEGEGEDYEDEVNRELEEEEEEEEGESFVKTEVESPKASNLQEKRVRTVRRLVERPKTVYERFPMFEKNKILDFTELFKGYTGTKPRVMRRPLQSTLMPIWSKSALNLTIPQWKRSIPSGKTCPRRFWKLL